MDGTEVVGCARRRSSPPWVVAVALAAVAAPRPAGRPLPTPFNPWSSRRGREPRGTVAGWSRTCPHCARAGVAERLPPTAPLLSHCSRGRRDARRTHRPAGPRGPVGEEITGVPAFCSRAASRAGFDDADTGRELEQQLERSGASSPRRPRPVGGPRLPSPSGGVPPSGFGSGRHADDQPADRGIVDATSISLPCLPWFSAGSTR